jgi:hypothetical protein
MTSWTLTADSGTPETVADANTVDIAGGAGVTTTVAATDTVTVALDTSEASSIASGTIAPAADGALVIDTDGDTTNIANDVLQFQSGTEDFLIPTVREYPTVNNECLVHNTTNDDWEWSGTDCTSGGATAWDNITVPSTAQSLAMAENASDFLYDTPTTAAADDYFLLSVDYDATTDSGEQNILTVRQIDGGTDATGTPDALLLLESTETTADDGPAVMLELRATTAGTAPIAIDASDAEIATALALGENDITVSGVTVTGPELEQLNTLGATTISANQWAAIGGMAETLGYAELDRLDGKDAALVDVDDAVGTAITGTTATSFGIETGGGGTAITDASIVFEGTGADDAFETTISITNPTVDRTITVPNADATVHQPFTCSNQFARSSASATGLVTCETVVDADVTFTTPALGTPSAIVLTNATGTAASLTAGTVTTNANLTGEVTSTGNATLITESALQENGASELLGETLGTACTINQILKSDGAGGLDCAADADTGGAPALSSVTSPTADTLWTYEDGEEHNKTQTNTSANAVNLYNFDQPDDADATDNVRIVEITATSESGDAGDLLSAFSIVYENGTANTIMDSAIKINNEETTASTMTDAIIVTSSGVDGGVTDALDASAANITNAINIGANAIAGTNFSVTGAGGITAVSIDGPTEVRSMYWGAGSMNADGCTAIAEVAIPSAGFPMWTSTCPVAATSQLYGSTTMPDSWDAGNVRFEVQSHHAASEVLTCNYDITCQCVGTGEAMNTTFTTEDANTVVVIATAALADQFLWDEQVGAIACAGSCSAGDLLRWELESETVGTGANCANTNILGVKMEYTSDIGDVL